MEAKKLINRKLKSIYFQWVINYQGPPPRSLADNFFEHLEYEYYDFSKDWLEKVLLECFINNQEEFNDQILLIEKEVDRYFKNQKLKIERRQRKRWNKFLGKCLKEDVLPF